MTTKSKESKESNFTGPERSASTESVCNTPLLAMPQVINAPVKDVRQGNGKIRCTNLTEAPLNENVFTALLLLQSIRTVWQTPDTCLG